MGLTTRENEGYYRDMAIAIVAEQKKIEKLVERVTVRVLKEILRKNTLSSLIRLAERGGSFDFLENEPDLYTLPRHAKR